MSLRQNNVLNHKKCNFPAECPLGFTENTGCCYKFVTEPATATAAQAACVAAGANLVTIDDVDENKFIQTQFG